MEHFYVVLPSDNSRYFPRNTVANFRTTLLIPIEIEPGKWEVGRIEISYPKGYKKHTTRYTPISTEIKFPVRH
jgi:hypothetical protein